MGGNLKIKHNKECVLEEKVYWLLLSLYSEEVLHHHKKQAKRYSYILNTTIHTEKTLNTLEKLNVVQKERERSCEREREIVRERERERGGGGGGWG